METTSEHNRGHFQRRREGTQVLRTIRSTRSRNRMLREGIEWRETTKVTGEIPTTETQKRTEITTPTTKTTKERTNTREQW